MKKPTNLLPIEFFEGGIIKSIGFVFAASFAGSAFVFISNLFLSNQFGPEGFGNFRTILSLFLFIPTFAELGANVTLTKYVAEIKEEPKRNFLIRWFLKLRFIVYLLVGVTILLFQKEVSSYFLKDHSLDYLIPAGIIVLLLYYFEIFKFISLGLQKFKVYSASQFLVPATSGILALVLGFYLGIYYALIGWGLGYLIGNIPNIKFSFENRLLGATEKLDVRRIFISYSIPTSIIVLPNILSNALIPFLSLLFSQKAIGYFSFGMMFYQGIVLIPNALFQVLLPKFSELRGENKLKEAKTKLKRVVSAYTLITILGSAAAILFSQVFISVLAPAYLPGMHMFTLTILLGFLMGYFYIYKSYYMASGEMRNLTVLVILQNLWLFVGSLLIMTT